MKLLRKVPMEVLAQFSSTLKIITQRARTEDSTDCMSSSTAHQHFKRPVSLFSAVSLALLRV